MENFSTVESMTETEKFEILNTVLENPHYDSIKQNVFFVKRNNEVLREFKLGGLTDVITQIESGNTMGNFDTPVAKAKAMTTEIDPNMGNKYTLKVDIAALKKDGINTEDPEIKSLISYVESNSEKLISDLAKRGYNASSKR